jgi:putative tricarboxylic transport membrane protein
MERMRVLFLVLAAVMILSFGANVAAQSSFPTKPVRIINYVAPGGLMDVTTRKFVDVAAKYTDAVFVVENRSGAGGLIGAEYVLSQPADGYTIFAPTTSVVVQVVATESDIDKYIWGFEWVSMLMMDPECIISNSQLPIHKWEDIVEDAKAKGGSQIWVGPSTGGNDHLMAMKVWDKAGITATWIPYESGPAAMAALMGGQGVAYVGNPADTSGRPDLIVCAVSSDERLPQYPDAPTFKELGIEGLDNEVMWRGFSMKKGSPPEAVAWLQDLVEKVAQDPEWKEFFEEQAIKVVAYRTDEFTETVKNNVEDAIKYFKEYGIIK